MIKPSRRYWTLAVRHDGFFVPEFSSFVRGEVIEEMSEWRRKGVRRSDLKIVASDPEQAAIDEAVGALNDAQKLSPAPKAPLKSPS
jgi:hypothetical protein